MCYRELIIRAEKLKAFRKDSVFFHKFTLLRISPLTVEQRQFAVAAVSIAPMQKPAAAASTTIPSPHPQVIKAGTATYCICLGHMCPPTVGVAVTFISTSHKAPLLPQVAAACRVERRKASGRGDEMRRGGGEGGGEGKKRRKKQHTSPGKIARMLYYI